MKIYTRTGDGGETGYIGGRISKASDLIELVGELDEINSGLGLIAAGLKQQKQKKLRDIVSHIHTIQTQIFDLGALVAMPALPAQQAAPKHKLIEEWTTDLEHLIDSWDEDLHRLQNFILPGGHELGARLHQSRAVCRRAERTAVRLIKNLTSQPDSQATYPDSLQVVQKYLNRLSDTLFTAARFVNKTLDHQEEVWMSGGEQMRLAL